MLECHIIANNELGDMVLLRLPSARSAAALIESQQGAELLGRRLFLCPGRNRVDALAQQFPGEAAAAQRALQAARVAAAVAVVETCAAAAKAAPAAPAPPKLPQVPPLPGAAAAGETAQLLRLASPGLKQGNRQLAHASSGGDELARGRSPQRRNRAAGSPISSSRSSNLSGRAACSRSRSRSPPKPSSSDLLLSLHPASAAAEGGTQAVPGGTQQAQQAQQEEPLLVPVSVFRRATRQCSWEVTGNCVSLNELPVGSTTNPVLRRQLLGLVESIGGTGRCAHACDASVPTSQWHGVPAHLTVPTSLVPVSRSFGCTLHAGRAA